jgi:NAD(P)-dependent dehydrogenase (short-subunit alcohol dehydrogenase family)
VTGVVMVTGASGALGRQVVEFLLERLPPDRVAALARRPESLDDLGQRGVSIRGGDYHDQERLEQAFHGVDKLLLVSAMAFTDAQTAHRNVVGAAQAAGVPLLGHHDPGRLQDPPPAVRDPAATLGLATSRPPHVPGQLPASHAKMNIYSLMKQNSPGGSILRPRPAPAEY